MSFAELRSLTLTPSELDHLKQVCFNNCQPVGEHLCFKGRDDQKYAHTTIKMRDKTFQMRKAQLSLFLKMKDVDFDMSEWTDSHTTSHLCHRKACLKQEHLNLETLEQNRERDECCCLRRCCGHKDLPKCIV